MKVNLRQGTCTPTLTPMPGVHHAVHETAARLRFRMNLKGVVRRRLMTAGVSLHHPSRSETAIAVS